MWKGNGMANKQQTTKTEAKKGPKAQAHMATKADTSHTKMAAVKVPDVLQGFMNFVREQGVVGLAVGLTIGTAVTVFVKSLVDNLVNPIIGVILPGGGDLAGRYLCLASEGGVCVNKLGWGAILSSLISFLTIAAVVYFIVHGLKLDRVDKKKD